MADSRNYENNHSEVTVKKAKSKAHKNPPRFHDEVKARHAKHPPVQQKMVAPPLPIDVGTQGGGLPVQPGGEQEMDNSEGGGQY